ncbi:MAG: hypothetical protein WD360_02470 [Nitriliruptoraceae bacterium]
MRSFAMPSVHQMTRVLLAVLVGFTLAVAATSAYADDFSQVVLAVEGGELGPEPAERLSEDNPARELVGYDDRDIPFTWGGAWLLAVTGLIGLGAATWLYQVKVVRPQKQSR